MTDKANVEISVRDGGTVVKLYAEEGDVVKIHSPLMDIDESGAPAAPSAKPAPKAEAPAPAAETPKPAASKPAAAPKPASKPAPVPVAQTSQPDLRPKTLATPAVRRRARELGVNLNAVPGSGKKGRVTRADVDASCSSHGSTFTFCRLSERFFTCCKMSTTPQSCVKKTFVRKLQLARCLYMRRLFMRYRPPVGRLIGSFGYI